MKSFKMFQFMFKRNFGMKLSHMTTSLITADVVLAFFWNFPVWLYCLWYLALLSWVLTMYSRFGEMKQRTICASLERRILAYFLRTRQCHFYLHWYIQVFLVGCTFKTPRSTQVLGLVAPVSCSSDPEPVSSLDIGVVVTSIWIEGKTIKMYWTNNPTYIGKNSPLSIKLFALIGYNSES